MDNITMGLPVQCKYCGGSQNYKTTDLTELQEAIEYDHEYLCNQCGSAVRINEALDPIQVAQFG